MLDRKLVSDLNGLSKSRIHALEEILDGYKTLNTMLESLIDLEKKHKKTLVNVDSIVFCANPYCDNFRPENRAYCPECENRGGSSGAA